MARFKDIQPSLAETLRASALIPAAISIVARKPGEVANDIEASLSKQGICIYVMPPVPLSAERTYNNIIFIKHSSLRIRIIEQPKLNLTGCDVWDVFNLVTLALQGTNPNNLFAAPICLAEHPVDFTDGQNPEGKATRVWDVLFDGAFQLTP